MIHFIYGDALHEHKDLASSMFKDRAEQFRNRLGWDVSVNELGEERDEYDDINPLYIIVSNTLGLHEASVRLLPTVGKTMVEDHFLHVTDGVRIRSPSIWECTRFCVSPEANPHSTSKIFAAGAKVMNEFFVEHCVGVFDRKMLLVYRRIGSVPTVIGWSSGDFGTVGVGLWEFNQDKYDQILAKSDISHLEMELYFANSGLTSIDGSALAGFAA